VSGEKDQPATSHRLKEARKRGQIAVSSEVNSAVCLLAVTAYLSVQAETMAGRLHALFALVLQEVGRAGSDRVAAIADVLSIAGREVALLCLPPLLVGAAAAVAMGLVQTRGLVAMGALRLDFGRVNPIRGAKQIFTVRNLVMLLKLSVGLLLIGSVAAVTYRDMLPDMLRAGHLSSHGMVALSWRFVLGLLLAGVVVAVLMASADWGIQLYSFHAGMRMSKQELKEEHKAFEGDPAIKGRQRAFFEELIDAATQSLIAESEVLIVNPTHVAIAIHYKPGKVDLPMVVAKGLDEVALAMRRIAEKAGVPIYEHRMLARDLFRECRKKEYIPHRHFEAVAEIFRWLAKMQGARRHAARTGAGSAGGAGSARSAASAANGRASTWRAVR
jgi:flagellar biosynthesis protein FlhB